MDDLKSFRQLTAMVVALVMVLAALLAGPGPVNALIAVGITFVIGIVLVTFPKLTQVLMQLFAFVALLIFVIIVLLAIFDFILKPLVALYLAWVAGLMAGSVSAIGVAILLGLIVLYLIVQTFATAIRGRR